MSVRCVSRGPGAQEGLEIKQTSGGAILLTRLETQHWEHGGRGVWKFPEEEKEEIAQVTALDVEVSLRAGKGRKL